MTFDQYFVEEAAAQLAAARRDEADPILQARIAAKRAAELAARAAAALAAKDEDEDKDEEEEEEEDDEDEDEDEE
jgi:hypothetical protein